ncbi:hypothetical protein MASR2M36_36210 [Providencia sp.]
MGGSSSVGSITIKAMVWFISAAIISLLIGMVFVNVFELGVGLNLTVPTAAVDSGLNTSGFTLKAFVTHIFP